jgi:hypothetical protein
VATWGGLGRVPGGDACRLSFALVKERWSPGPAPGRTRLRELVERAVMPSWAGGGEHRMTHKHGWPTSVTASWSGGAGAGGPRV